MPHVEIVFAIIIALLAGIAIAQWHQRKKEQRYAKQQKIAASNRAQRLNTICGIIRNAIRERGSAYGTLTDRRGGREWTGWVRLRLNPYREVVAIECLSDSQPLSERNIFVVPEETLWRRESFMFSAADIVDFQLTVAETS